MPLQKYFLLFLFYFINVPGSGAQPIKYQGKIAGKGDIEMELNSSDDKNFTGRYHQTGKPDWTNIAGNITGETQSNLVLKEVAKDDKPAGTFNLFFEGDALTGTWTNGASAKTFGVSLELKDEELEAVYKDTMPDGYYYVRENELRVKTINKDALEVAIWVSNTTGCTGLLLKGRMIPALRGWTGTLSDELEHGNAKVTILFSGNLYAQVLIEPKFTQPTSCNVGFSIYERSKRKEEAELE